jgi:hypothetical protein
MKINMEQSYEESIAAVVAATGCDQEAARKVVESISELVLATLASFTITIYEEENQNATSH